MDPTVVFVIDAMAWAMCIAFCLSMAILQRKAAKRMEDSFDRLIRVVTGAEAIKQSRPPKPPEPPKAPIPKKTGKRLTIQHSI